MNIIQLQDMLKVMPDDRLKQELSAPSGSVPQYLVLSEVVRRDKLRSEAAERPTTTVVQDLLGAGQQAPPQEMPQPEMPQAYAGGGFISASESMGNAGFRGYPTQQPKIPNPVSANTGITSMFAPSPAAKPAAPQTVNNVQVSQPQPKFDDGQSNSFDSPSYYEQGAYADGGPIRMAAGDYVSRLSLVESGNNPRAKNPLSTAGGLGQFIDSTWLAYLNATQPGLVDRIGKKAAIELKYDPELSKQATAWYADENAKALSGAGFEPTQGKLYLAHFLGPAGATAILKADPNTPAVDILGQKVVDANPVLKNMNAGQVANWTDQRMAGKGGEAPTGSGQKGKAMFNISDLFFGRPYGAGQGAAGFEARTEGAPAPQMATRSNGIMSILGLNPTQEARDRMGGDLKEAGIEMMKPKKMAYPEIPKMAPADVSGLAALRSNPDELAAAMADYSKYISMASGGPVRMADGETVPGIEGFPYIPDEPYYGAEINPEVVQKAIEFATQNPAGNRGPLGPGGEPRSVGKSTNWTFSPAEQAAAEATIQAKRPQDEKAGVKEKTPLQELLDFYKGQTTALQAEYARQRKEEEDRMKESGGMGAFLRRMGIGMLTDSSSLGRSIQAGAAAATSGGEESRQKALDAIRALDLKERMVGLDNNEAMAKLTYQAAVAQDEAARAGRAGQKDYLAQVDDIGKMISAREDVISGNGGDPSKDPEIAALRKIQAEIMQKAGLGATMGSGTGLPAGIVVTRK